jgi:hypothetical protein
MAPDQYSTLLSALQHVPDPRKARGKRYSWTLLLTLIVAGLASNYQTARAIAQWARLHASELRAALPELVRIPSSEVGAIWRNTTAAASVKTTFSRDWSAAKSL